MHSQLLSFYEANRACRNVSGSQLASFSTSSDLANLRTVREERSSYSLSLFFSYFTKRSVCYSISSSVRLGHNLLCEIDLSFDLKDIVFGGHMSFCSNWHPCFGFLVTFKARVSKPEWVLPCSLFCGGECNVHCLGSTAGATRANLLAASSVAGHFPTCISIGWTWLGFERAIFQTEE